jgi:glycosyltransferase involved in cell wall biosynthesis
MRVHGREGGSVMKGRVLHVTEAMGGGIISACLEMAAASPEWRHDLLYARRGDYDTGDLLGAPQFASITETSGRRDLFTTLRRELRRNPPDALHLHSAWAGLLGRIILVYPARRILYSPHSFYFDRSTAPRSVRLLAHTVERLLALRTGQIVAVGPHEAAQARALGAATVLVPNVVRLRDLPPEDRPGPGDMPLIVAVGRVAEQKDPLFFRDVVRTLRGPMALPCDAVWVGGGDAELTDVLRRDGIDVTGWIPRAEVLRLLRSCSVYVHTAAWEGNPMTVHEAAACGTPVVARSIPALTSLGFPAALVDPEDVAADVRKVIHAGGDLGSVPVVEAATEEQSRSLATAYRRAAGTR